MIEVVSVRFSNKGKVYFFDPSGLDIASGKNLIVETAKGIEYGLCTQGNHPVQDTSVVQPLRPVIRVATEQDEMIAKESRVKEKTAFEYCQKRILHYKLDMKLVGVECGFDGSKILFFFTSDGRVDFRSLVKDLAGVFKTRIELRQIGVRDEAKMLGGLGFCGKQFCCSQFLTEFHPVSIKMAKTQGLSLNPTKISGTCGRLMCCLKYEESAYDDLVSKAPKPDAFVETPAGKGTVYSVNLLRGNAKIRLEDGLGTTLKTFTFEELDVLGGKARRAEYIAAKADGRLEEAGFKKSAAPVLPEIEKPDGQVNQNEKSSRAPRQQPGAKQYPKKNPNQQARKPQQETVKKPLTERKPPEKQKQKEDEKTAANTPPKKPNFRQKRGSGYYGKRRNSQKDKPFAE